jgi:phosphonate transport system permease protein
VATPATPPGDGWKLRQPFGPRLLLLLIAAAVVLAISFTRVDLHRGVLNTGEAIQRGAGFVSRAWPVRLEEAHRVERMVQIGEMRQRGAPPPADPAARARWDRMIDPDDLPLFARIEDRPVNPREPGSPVEPFYVERFGYLSKCISLMIDTIEMALWGTLLCVVLALPLGFFAARNYTSGHLTYHTARALCSFVRAIPELIVALILVIMYGPGPVAGILALGFHTSGFLGKFFADDIENAEPGPQQALRATGANRLKVLRLAVLPQVLPQYVAYIQYILERNVRTATILGVVSAGGIGFELMARLKNGEYDAVATILIIVFASVFALEQATQRLRARLI